MINVANLCPSEYTLVITKDPLEVMQLYSLGALNLSMKFHGCLFSFYTGLPFYAISNTRKIENFCKDIYYSGQCLKEDVPIRTGFLTDIIPFRNGVLQKMITQLSK
jgi:polysaccharide pyruvyl transferase WcaK-like protein